MIVELRKRNGYSQSSLAKELGVSQQTVSHWENRDRDPPITMLIKMTEIFGCTLDELVRGEKK